MLPADVKNESNSLLWNCIASHSRKRRDRYRANCALVLGPLAQHESTISSTSGVFLEISLDVRVLI